MPMRKRQVLFVILTACSLGLLQGVAEASWDSNGTPVCTAQDWQGEDAIASDGHGGVVITWTDYRDDTTSNVYAQRLSGSGVPQWTSGGVPVCTAALDQYRPQVISDGNGGVVIAWWDTRDDSSIDLYAQRLDSQGVSLWDVNGIPICVGSSRQWFPTLIGDGTGGFIITFSDDRNGDSDIYAQWINGNGVAQWATNGIALCIATNLQGLPSIATDGAGGAIVSWWDFRSGQADIYAQRVNSAGAVLWGAVGVPICTAADSQNEARTVADGAGGAIVAWTDFRSGSADMYAQRVSSSGAPQWTSNGVLVCSAASTQAQHLAISDGAGGAIIAWVDSRDYALNRQDIYAQRLDPSGSSLWAPNGVPICTASLIQYELSLCSDGDGGAIITWEDARADVHEYAYDIYAQRIGGNGTTLWAANGIPVCTASDAQYQPELVNDGSGVVIAWYDMRNEITSSDLYARRLTLEGQLPTAVRPTSTPGAISIGANVPNPFSSATRFDVFVSGASTGTMEVYDVTGRRMTIRQLSGLREGWQTVSFDGRDSQAAPLPSGVYFVRVKAAGHTATRKMIIQR